jgi:uncharacterized membrane protein YeaQ/YmgE (transglycosylase-associated protein family)
MILVLFIAVGSIAGVLAGRVVSGHRYGVLADVFVGVIGAFLGGSIATTGLGVGGGGVVMALLIASIGAITLLWLIRLVAPSRA